MTVLFGAAVLPVCFPRGLSAQPARMPRLGVLLYSTAQADPNAESFRRGLRDLGYVDGRNIAIEYRAAEGRPERLPELAADLVRGKPDVLFALGGDVTQVAAKATQTVPIVFVSSADPVQLGLVASLARPGGNATGVTLLMDELASKRLELLKEIVPNTSRVAFLWNPDHIDNELREAERAASSLGMTLLRLASHGPGNLDAILRVARDGRADALYVVSSRQTVRGLDKVVAFADRYRLPLAGGWGAWAQAGGLLSYGPNVDDMVRRATTYVDRILKGTRPADLPVQQPTKFELVINLKTARALGLTVAESFLLRADRVID
jgi:putative ABC transport system substrate-binding protein